MIAISPTLARHAQRQTAGGGEAVRKLIEEVRINVKPQTQAAVALSKTPGGYDGRRGSRKKKLPSPPQDHGIPDKGGIVSDGNTVTTAWTVPRRDR